MPSPAVFPKPRPLFGAARWAVALALGVGLALPGAAEETAPKAKPDAAEAAVAEGEAAAVQTPPATDAPTDNSGETSDES